MSGESRWIEPLAELIVRFGLNLQPDQMVRINSEPGKEPLTRAVATAAYRAGARFVEVETFDLHIKRARALHADPESLSFVPPWLGEAAMARARAGVGIVSLSGPAEPGLMDDVDAALLGRDMLPRLRESSRIVAERMVNWTVAPCPTRAWATLVFPELDGEAAYTRLWEEIAHVCRLDTPDPVAAWTERLETLREVKDRLSALALDELHFEGPGTDLTLGLFPGAEFTAASLSTAAGLVHRPNLPTEEVFTSPDPERTRGHVRCTRPLVAGGKVIRDLEVRFEAGRVVAVAASDGADTFRSLSEQDEGAGRLGEVALVDRAGRIGPLDTVFFDTLLDENAASHIAIGGGFPFLIPEAYRSQTNESAQHVDFMIGSPEVRVTGRTRDGAEIPLLRDGHWQI